MWLVDLVNCWSDTHTAKAAAAAALPEAKIPSSSLFSIRFFHRLNEVSHRFDEIETLNTELRLEVGAEGGAVFRRV